MNDINTALVDSQAEGPEQTLPKIAVLHIPHSSRQVPTEVRQAVLLDDARLNNELLRMTDAHTDALFPPTPVEAGRVVFPVSRLICVMLSSRELKLQAIRSPLIHHLPARWSHFRLIERIAGFCPR